MEMQTLPLSKVYMRASDRLAAKHELRDKVRQHVKDRTVRYLDQDRIWLRLERLLKNPLMEKKFRDRGVFEELRGFVNLAQLSPLANSELERTIGEPDYLPIWFLSRGTELRRTVARVRARSASGKDLKGTGFLVGPRLLLTNFHVLDWTDIDQEPLQNLLSQSFVEFDYEEQYDGLMRPVVSFRLDPATLLLTSPMEWFDYVLVALQQRSMNGALSIDDFGYNRLAGDIGKINRGEPVFIIQHPEGRTKQVVVQNNLLIDRDEEIPYLTYEADTSRGSSGSPVFNRQWEVVALHHSVEIKRNKTGQILTRNGDVWKPEMGSAEIQYLELNEGVRISRILDDLEVKLTKLRRDGLNALGGPESSSSEGLALLDRMLQTHLGVSPMELIAPIPIERNEASSTSGAGRSEGFSRPD